jgi:hypothetical protein
VKKNFTKIQALGMKIFLRFCLRIFPGGGPIPGGQYAEKTR